MLFLGSGKYSLRLFALALLLGSNHQLLSQETGLVRPPKARWIEELEQEYLASGFPVKAEALRRLAPVVRGATGLEGALYFEEYSRMIEAVLAASVERGEGSVISKRSEEAMAAIYEEFRPRLFALEARLRRIPDRMSLRKGRLREHIDRVFKIWDGSSFRDDISFDEMCEGLLPYRVGEERLRPWIGQAALDHNALIEHAGGFPNSREAMAHLRYELWKPLLNLHYIGGSRLTDDTTYGSLQVRQPTDCYDEAAYLIYVARAAGIPASLYVVPAWGNRMRAEHAWADCYNSDGVGLPEGSKLDNVNRKVDTNVSLPGSYVDYLREDFPGFEAGLDIQFTKRVPKVFRKVSLVDPRVENSFQSSTYIDDFLSKRWEDVTSWYLDTVNFTIPLDASYAGQQVFLAVFSPDGWDPVDGATVDEAGNVTFEHVGPNIIYTCGVAGDGEIRPRTQPFVVNSDGALRFLEPNFESVNPVELFRKYPLFANSARFRRAFWKGRFVFWNSRRGETDSSWEYKVDGVERDWIEFELPSNDFDSMRFIAREGAAPAAVAELEFYSELGRLEITPAESSVDSVSLLEKVQDGDYATFQALPNDASMMLELKEGQSLNEVRIIPRSDTNFVEPGDEYELFYFDEGWKSVARKRAGSFSLAFEGLPSGALFWLRNLTKGREERPFTIEGGKQVFW